MAATVQHMADDMEYVCWIQSFLQSGMIVAGWDKYGGGSVYGIPLGGTLLRLPFSSGGL
jgi:20S proteasome alpha/beta subunit